MSWMRKIGAGDLGAGAKRIGFVSGFLTVGAGQGRFKTGTVLELELKELASYLVSLL